MRRDLLVLGLAVAASLLVACRANEPAPAPAAPPAAAREAASQPAAPPDPPAAPPSEPIRTATHKGITDAALLIAQEQGYFAEEGLNVDFVPLNATQAPVLLGTNQLEVAGTSVTAGLINAIQRGVSLKVVADKSSAPPGGGFNGLVVRKQLVDSGAFRGLGDLAGRRIAIVTSDLGSPNAIEVMAALSQGGLTLDDVETVALPFADMNQAVANGSVDAALQTEPFVALGVEQGLFVRWIGNDALVPYHQNVVLTYSPGFAATDAAKRYMVAYVRALRDYHRAFVKGERRDEIVALLARAGTVKDVELYQKIVMPGLNPDGYVDLAALERDQATFLSLGQIQAPLPMDQLVDHSFVEYALARLGHQ
jgi:NitT/TauT family transport system substrate-binding protein